MVAELVKQGAITEEMAQIHPYKNVITRAVGTHESIEVDILKVAKKEGDQWILCTDGLTNYVSQQNMALFFSELSLENIEKELLLTALCKGGGDNITFLLLEVKE